jgi:hypothetical protein
MVLEHIAAIFFFSGPLFFIGLLMAIDPAGIPTLSQWLLRVFRHFVQRLGGCPSEEIVEPEQTAISHRLRRALRFAGVALLVFAIVV